MASNTPHGTAALEGNQQDDSVAIQRTMVVAPPAIPVAASLTTGHNTTDYSATNLPDLLFRLEAPLDWGNTEFAPLRGPNGRVRRKPNGQPYQQFPWLPNRISIPPEAFLLEYWNREHPDCSYADFEIRMQPGPNERLPARNTLNMRRIREVRLPLNIPSWLQKGEKVTMTDCLIFESLSLNSVRRNTVLPVRPWGLVKPTLPGLEVLEVNHQNATGAAAPPAPPAPLPLCTFTDGGATHVPSARLEAIKKLTSYLQDTAFESMLAHWIFLRDQEKPSWWDEHRRTGDENTINIPLLQALPYPAKDWIKECVREAGEIESGLIVPPTSVLPRLAQGWVTECLKEGRARSTDPTIRERVKSTWSLEIDTSDDSHISKLSLSLNYATEDEEEGEVKGSENISDASDSSSVSETFFVPRSTPEISERTETTWEEHWKKRHRGKAVAEVLKTGQADTAAILPGYSATVVTSDGRLLIFKNVLILPKAVDGQGSHDTEDDQGRASKRRRTELQEIEPPNIQ